MLRYLSSYIFQTENEPSDIGDPNSEQLGPSDQNEKIVLQNGGTVPPNNAIVKGNVDELMEFDGGDALEEEDDWVLIGEENRKKEEQVVEQVIAKVEDEKKDDPPRLQVQPEVNLVAAPSTEEEDEEDSEEDEVTQDLLWENKLIEHPSMSVYVDLATSISNVASSCVSLSSIAATTSPGESVIVVEQPDSEDEDIESSDDSDDDDDSSMDFVEAIAAHEPLPQLQTAEQIHLVDDEDTDDSSDEENKVKISTSVKAPLLATPAPAPSAPVQNGRRKKGHYPNSSSHSTQMPRRTHLRNSGCSTTSSSTNSFINLSGGAPDAPHDAIKRMKRSGNSSQNNQQMNPPTCGIAMVNGAPPTVPNGMVKNIKLIDLFPSAGAAAKRRNFPQKSGTTQKGHFLQEGRRRQDLQNYTKRSSVNNDRRSAQQRRVPQQKGATANGSGGRGK